MKFGKNRVVVWVIAAALSTLPAATVMASESCLAQAHGIQSRIETMIAQHPEIRSQTDLIRLHDDPCAAPGTQVSANFTMVIIRGGGPAAGGNSFVRKAHSLGTEYQHAKGGLVSDRAFFCADGRIYLDLVRCQ